MKQEDLDVLIKFINKEISDAESWALAYAEEAFFGGDDYVVARWDSRKRALNDAKKYVAEAVEKYKDSMSKSKKTK